MRLRLGMTSWKDDTVGEGKRTRDRLFLLLLLDGLVVGDGEGEGVVVDRCSMLGLRCPESLR